MKTGLILTMGFSAEPLIYSIREQQADYVVFIGTNASLKASVDETVFQSNLRPSQFNKLEINDSPDEIGTLCELFQTAKTWLEDQGADDILADPTGGRKWMSAGAVMVASFLGIPMLYVDSKYDNVKEKVIPESMKTVQLGNAYDQTGFIIAEKGIASFNSHNFEQAAGYFEQITPTNAHKQSLYSGLANLSISLAHWDRFKHYHSKISDDIRSSITQIEQALRSGAGNSELAIFSDRIELFRKKIQEMEGGEKLSVDFITDIFLNAQRRINLNRYDDAVARHYRTLEAVSQYFLKKQNIQASNPDYSILSEEQKDFFLSNILGTELPSKITLKDGFWLLKSLGHPAGEKAIRLGKNGKSNFVFESILNTRNESILAHGFTPINKDNAQKFHSQLESYLQNTFEGQFESARKTLIIPQLPQLGF